MALDLEIIVRDRDTGNETDKFVQLSLSPRELGHVHKLQEAILSGLDIDIQYQED